MYQCNGTRAILAVWHGLFGELAVLVTCKAWVEEPTQTIVQFELLGQQMSRFKMLLAP